ncbi:MAG TPA: hypothetical protein VFN11_01525 [Ktedonobacterales bacterium]|nr:hypothetical protein [Ktedonobacterales bacterium]
MNSSSASAAVVAAPVEVVWANLVHWERYANWADVQVERLEPAGPITVGQTVYFMDKALGRTLRFRFTVDAINPERYQLDMHAFFPCGLQEKTHVACTPIDATSCHVQYG